jgi:hypothetical protein
MDENGIAKADDFRLAAESNAFEPPRKIVLPHSGMGVVLRRPKVIAFSLDTYGLPASLALRLQGLELQPSEVDGEQLRALKLFWVSMFARMFAQPVLSLTPGPGEIHPSWIPDADQTFLVKWAVGEVDDSNVSLAKFRREQEPSSPREESKVPWSEAEPASVVVN